MGNQLGEMNREMNSKMGEMNNKIENVETNMETMKRYLQELRKAILTWDGNDKGKTLVDYDPSSLYSPLIRETLTPPLTKKKRWVMKMK